MAYTAAAAAPAATMMDDRTLNRGIMLHHIMDQFINQVRHWTAPGAQPTPYQCQELCFAHWDEIHDTFCRSGLQPWEFHEMLRRAAELGLVDDMQTLWAEVSTTFLKLRSVYMPQGSLNGTMQQHLLMQAHAATQHQQHVNGIAQQPQRLSTPPPPPPPKGAAQLQQPGAWGPAAARPPAVQRAPSNQQRDAATNGHAASDQQDGRKFAAVVAGRHKQQQPATQLPQQQQYQSQQQQQQQQGQQQGSQTAADLTAIVQLQQQHKQQQHKQQQEQQESTLKDQAKADMAAAYLQHQQLQGQLTGMNGMQPQNGYIGAWRSNVLSATNGMQPALPPGLQPHRQQQQQLSQQQTTQQQAVQQQQQPNGVAHALAPAQQQQQQQQQEAAAGADALKSQQLQQHLSNGGAAADAELSPRAPSWTSSQSHATQQDVTGDTSDPGPSYLEPDYLHMSAMELLPSCLLDDVYEKGDAVVAFAPGGPAGMGVTISALSARTASLEALQQAQAQQLAQQAALQQQQQQTALQQQPLAPGAGTAAQQQQQQQQQAAAMQQSVLQQQQPLPNGFAAAPAPPAPRTAAPAAAVVQPVPAPADAAKPSANSGAPAKGTAQAASPSPAKKTAQQSPRPAVRVVAVPSRGASPVAPSPKKPPQQAQQQQQQQQQGQQNGQQQQQQAEQPRTPDATGPVTPQPRKLGSASPPVTPSGAAKAQPQQQAAAQEATDSSATPIAAAAAAAATPAAAPQQPLTYAQKLQLEQEWPKLKTGVAGKTPAAVPAGPRIAPAPESQKAALAAAKLASQHKGAAGAASANGAALSAGAAGANGKWPLAARLVAMVRQGAALPALLRLVSSERPDLQGALNDRVKSWLTQDCDGPTAECLAVFVLSNLRRDWLSNAKSPGAFLMGMLQHRSQLLGGGLARALLAVAKETPNVAIYIDSDVIQELGEMEPALRGFIIAEYLSKQRHDWPEGLKFPSQCLLSCLRSIRYADPAVHKAYVKLQESRPDLAKAMNGVILYGLCKCDTATGLAAIQRLSELPDAWTSAARVNASAFLYQKVQELCGGHNF